MELELKKNRLDHYETGPELTWTQEETAETIVPDYCPDIARIIAADGCAYLHSRELREDHAELSGTICLTVLYVPEKEGGIRSLDINIPFTSKSERGSFADSQMLLADTQIELLDTRMLNPRKVFTHCKLVHRASGYRKAQMCFCSDNDGAQDFHLEKLREERSVILLSAIAEKDFTFTEELSVSSGRSGAAALLHSRVSTVVTETKLVGSKLIFKGMFHVQILYRGTDDTYGMTTAELPFSQIMESEAAGEQAAVQMSLQLTGAELHIMDEQDGRRIEVTFYVRASAQLRETHSLQLLSDLYSTAWDTSYEAVPLQMTSAHRCFTHRQTVREVLEMGGRAESLLALWVTCTPVAVSGSERATLRTNLLVRAIVADEGGAPMLAERRMEVTGQLDLLRDEKIHVRACCPETPQGTLTDRGIEVRFPVEFTVEAVTEQKRVCISSANLDESAPRDMSGAPSLVLRRLGKQESAWDLAKSCNSTIADLMAANQLEGEIPTDRLLLIPRKRA